MNFKQQLRTVLVFTKLSTRRFFRDRLAIFFGILFPLIFLFVFGGMSSGGNNPTFKIALLNQSSSSFARQLETNIDKGGVFKVDKTVTSLSQAEEKLTRGQIDGIVILPDSFGDVPAGQKLPEGQAKFIYSQSNASAGQTLLTVLQGSFTKINASLVPQREPLSIKAEQLNRQSLKPFDYTFAGLLGFSIIGLGIFGPVNVFPELKKQGILRRLHTTPLRVWQYFLSTMFSQALIGLVAIGIQYAVALSIFHLKVAGNYLEIAVFTVLGIFLILGIGLAVGGWARNERQAAPLANIIVFPMLFLSGTFFPRFLMPQWLQTVSGYLPLTPVIDGLRLLTTEGKHLLDLGPQLGLMAVWTAVIYVIALRVFRWE